MNTKIVFIFNFNLIVLIVYPDQFYRYSSQVCLSSSQFCNFSLVTLNFYYNKGKLTCDARKREDPGLSLQ